MYCPWGLVLDWKRWRVVPVLSGWRQREYADVVCHVNELQEKLFPRRERRGDEKGRRDEEEEKDVNVAGRSRQEISAAAVALMRG